MIRAIKVLPSEWGTAKKPWFIFTTSYWCPGRANKAAIADNAELLKHFESQDRDSVEPVDGELRAQVAAGECVAIRGELGSEGRGTRGFLLITREKNGPLLINLSCEDAT